MKLLLTVLTMIALDAHALNVFAKRRHPIGTRTAVVHDSVFTLHGGRIYRAGRDEPPKSFARRPHFEKIARFTDLLVGLTYGGELMFWRERESNVWETIESGLEVRGVVDFAATPHVLVSVDRRGLAHQWPSITKRGYIPGPVNVVAVEAYHDGGFGLTRADGGKIFLKPSPPNCNELLIDIPR